MAFAALLSLTHVLERTLNRDHQYLTLDEKQQIASLLEIIGFLQVSLDNSSPISVKTVEFWESQMTHIRDAAYKAEDIIESHITDRVQEESACQGGESFTTFFYKLEKVREEIDSIKKSAEKIEHSSDVKDERRQWSSIPVNSSRIASSAKSTVVGFDDDLLEIKTRLISGSSDLQTVALVGMGGIGKTTLAKQVYDDASTVYHFHIRAWVTVSQDFNVREILLGLLDCTKNLSNQMPNESIDELLELLYKTLKGRRYLIVMDDVWDTKFWDDASVKCVLPNDENGSRIMLTTRQEKVAFYANSRSPLHHMHFLDDEDSWKLFCEKVFGEDCCPPELKGIGTKIVQHCKGLPLAIVVIGGLLSKLNRTQNDWKIVAENLSSVMTSNDERYSKILSLSYNYLPHHVKGCFLYMAIFPEAYHIRVSTLVKLWIAEGLIRPVRFKILEDVAEEYVLDLIERSLIMIFEKSCTGKIKTCKMHDLLRDLCMTEAKKAIYFHVTNTQLERVWDRIITHPKSENSSGTKFQTTSLLRRSILNFFYHGDISSDVLNFRLFRVLHNVIARPEDILGLVNLRFFTGKSYGDNFPAPLYKLRNLQALLLHQSASITSSWSLYPFYLPPEIWKMQQLRHVQLEATVNLPDPPSTEIEGEGSIIILGNLQTLSLIENFRCTVEVLKRIQNLKKLGIYYGNEPLDWEYYCLNNLVLLHKLEALKCFFYWKTPSFLKNVSFPTSLKKLTFINGFLPWEDITVVGSLPDLQVLKLKSHSFTGSEWEPNEGEFLQLQCLLLEEIDLKHWRADTSHFPKLQRLLIKSCKHLEEIPSSIGEIATLQSIELHYCRPSLLTSAMQIKETQLSFGNDDLQVRRVA